MNILEARSVSKHVGSRQVLATVSLEVAQGRATVVRGRNGSGKTTLLSILTGHEEPTSGEVLLRGEPLGRRVHELLAEAAVLLGELPFYHDITLHNHLELIAATWSGERPASSAADMLERFGIGYLAKSFPHELSSGERQLFALACTMHRPHRILMLDEPEQRLDLEHRARLRDILLAERAEQRALLIATHDPLLIEALGDRVVSLERA